MNKKQWTGLLMIYISYLLLGATVFYFIEAESEASQREVDYYKYTNITSLIKDLFQDRIKERENFTNTLTEYCGKNFKPDLPRELVAPEIWDFYNAFFFVVTVVSTIGYGNLHPSTDESRVLMIVYAVIGIPLNGILLSSLGQFFSAVFRKAHRKYKSNRGEYGKRYKLAINVVTYLAPGLIIFIFLPAAVFTYFEDHWSYIEGVYFAFVTLTTIGFGDLVAGQRKGDGSLESFYKIMLILWVIFGLGYLIMLLGFVAQAMQNKKIIRLEEKLMAGLTHNRIWHGFAKDLGYLRRAMNELYLDKLKPVFRDEKEPVPLVFHRSKSLPDFLKGLSDNDSLNIPQRERAKSVHVPHKGGLVKVFSETDLQRIDKNATFAATTTLPSNQELIQKIVGVFAGPISREWSSYGDSSEGGIGGVEGFSDEEVLASENWTSRGRNPASLFDLPFYQDTVSRQPHRGRAMSESQSAEGLPSTNPAGSDWTWSGPNANKLHDIIKQRTKQKMLMGLNKGRSGSISSALASGAKLMNPLRRRRRCVTESNSQENVQDTYNNGKDPKTASMPAGIDRKRPSLPDEKLQRIPRRDLHYMTTPAVPGSSGDDFSRQLHQIYSRGDTLFNGNGNKKDLLEETSIADFLRVLTSLHSTVGERLVSNNQNPKPRRKMGTASLTPPRIRSLLELFPETTAPPSPKPYKKRKPSKIMNLFRTDSKKEPNDTASIAAANEKTPESSNLKRFGRFLLRSYSTTPKDNEDLPRSFRKRFSLWPGDQEGKDSPPFQLQVDSPSEASTDITITIEPDETSSTPIYPRTSTRTAGLLYPPGDSETTTRRRTNSNSSNSSRKLPRWSFGPSDKN